MISLKKYLDMETGSLGPREPDPNDLACAALDSYGSVLLAMGKSGVRACPALGSDLHGGLTSLEKRLSAKISAALVRNTKSMLRSTCTNGQAGAVKRGTPGKLPEISNIEFPMVAGLPRVRRLRQLLREDASRFATVLGRCGSRQRR